MRITTVQVTIYIGRLIIHIDGEYWARLNSISKKVKQIQQIKSDRFTIGRLPTSDLAISDPRLSGTHCVIMRKYNKDG